jgi:hypothetical protein
VSLGAISTMERRASAALEAAYDEALREVQHAGVKHTDATSWTRAGVLMSLWTLACTAATVYRIFADGCRETILPLFGPQRGILVSDRATVFGFWAMPLRQICHATCCASSCRSPSATARPARSAGSYSSSPR